MGTRATIRFRDSFNEFFVYRGHDGFPDTVMNDIQEVIEAKKHSWSGSECSLLVTSFIGWKFDKQERLPNYELTTSFHGDEDYRYFVDYDENAKGWVAKYDGEALWLKDEISLKFAPPFDQKVLSGWKKFTVRDEDKSGEFILHGKRYRSVCFDSLSVKRFLNLVKEGFFQEYFFGFDSTQDMLDYYVEYFSGKRTKAYIHQISER